MAIVTLSFRKKTVDRPQKDKEELTPLERKI
jgi:hypothetical protein